MTAQPVRQTVTRSLLTDVTRAPLIVREAQKLRFQVFSEEYGCDLGAAEPGIDADRFDPWCDHLIVRDQRTGELVATTRILLDSQAVQTDGFYSASEFDLSTLLANTGKVAELGRTCVHPDYRNGATIALLWSTLASWLTDHQVDQVIGCASIGMSDGGHRAWRIARHLQERYLSDDDFRVWPHRAMPHLAHTNTSGFGEKPVKDIPALIKAYMRLGARVCGEPCWDPEFRCADLLVMLQVSDLSDRYSRHFMRPQR